VSDTFLERFGLFFDPHLRIVSVERGSAAWRRGLRPGMRLLMIDGRPVASWRDIRRTLSEKLADGIEPLRFLWEENDFQFFVTPYAL